MKNKNESGSIMLEVIALLTIIAIITPLIVRQQIQRNIEISNINIADEMRMVKDSVAAYLEANKADIAKQAYPNGGTETTSSTPKFVVPTNKADIEKFFPSGTDVIDDYSIDIYGYYVNDGNETEPHYVPRAFALISPDPESIPTLSLKRARRIASLVGASGAICSGSEISGSYGAWGFGLSADSNKQMGNCSQRRVVARTDL